MGLIEQRLVNVVIQLALLGLMQWWMVRSLRRAAPILQIACPRCDYTLTGCRSRKCPECGWSITGDRLVENWRLDLRGRIIVFIALRIVMLAFGWFWIATGLLEVNRLVKVGPFAFLPGYSLFDKTTNGVDIAIPVVCAGAMITWLLLAAASTRRASEKRLDRLSLLARELDAKLRASESQHPG
jgi:hypothetical protein